MSRVGKYFFTIHYPYCQKLIFVSKIPFFKVWAPSFCNKNIMSELIIQSKNVLDKLTDKCDGKWFNSCITNDNWCFTAADDQSCSVSAFFEWYSPILVILISLHQHFLNYIESL